MTNFFQTRLKLLTTKYQYIFNEILLYFLQLIKTQTRPILFNTSQLNLVRKLRSQTDV